MNILFDDDDSDGGGAKNVETKKIKSKERTVRITLRRRRVAIRCAVLRVVYYVVVVHAQGVRC